MRPAIRNGGIVAVLLAGATGLMLGVRAFQRRTPAAGMSFRERVVVVTGGARGLGFDIAAHLVDDGARVVLFDRDPEDLAEAVRELALRGREAVMGIPCDVAHEPTVRTAIRRVVERYGKLDGVVNAAGLISVAPTEALTRAGWHDALATSFWGPLHLLDAALPHLQRQSGAFIVRIGRASVDALAEDLHHGLEEEGIAVINVDPGYAASAPSAPRPSHTWFDVVEQFPVLPVSVEEAGEQIFEAMKHGRSEVRLGPSRFVSGVRRRIQAAGEVLRARLYRSLPPPLGVRGRWRAIPISTGDDTAIPS